MMGAIVLVLGSGCASDKENKESNTKGQEEITGISGVVEVEYNENADALEGEGLLFQLDKKEKNAFVISHSDMELEHVRIPDEIIYEEKEYPVTKISKGAFESNQTITKVVFGANLETIGASAFYACPVLEEIVLSDAVISIGKEAFATCNMLQKIQWNETVQNIGESAFLGCESIEKLSLPGSITQWGAGVFMDCTGLTECELQEGITTIGAELFTNCSSLTKVILPETVSLIGEESFWGCYELTELELPDTVISIGDRAFYSTSIASLCLPAGLSEVQLELLEGMDCIEEIQVPKSQKDMYQEVFADYGLRIKTY